MAESVKAKWHGDNYQARIFWENALNLFNPNSCVVEVTFEANGPKAFDDVVVKYDPPVPRTGPERISAEYHQVKWHVEMAGRFGVQDLIEPAFIGAESSSLLERLRDARAQVKHPSIFTFVTTYRIKDGDPLAEMISGVDRSLMLNKLFDGTKTDGSRMGEVRKLWREHLKLNSNDELRAVLDGFRIIEGHRSLEEMRTEINLKAQVVGLLACSKADSDFRYDELARQLKIRNLNSLTRSAFEKICKEESLYAEKQPQAETNLKIAIRSFLGPAADVSGALPENTLVLTEFFNQRYLQDDLDWQKDIRPKITAFLRESVKKSSSLELILDAHASIAFISGSVLDLKSATTVSLVQKGRIGTRKWIPNDGSHKDTQPLKISESEVGKGNEIAVGISLTHSVLGQMNSYVTSKLSQVGKIVDFEPVNGPNQQSVQGGEHAAKIAEQIATAIRKAKGANPDALVHIFGACPNSVLFYLGQSHQTIAPCVIYEFDFDRQRNKSYQPSVVFD